VRVGQQSNCTSNNAIVLQNTLHLYGLLDRVVGALDGLIHRLGG